MNALLLTNEGIFYMLTQPLIDITRELCFYFRHRFNNNRVVWLFNIRTSGSNHSNRAFSVCERNCLIHFLGSFKLFLWKFDIILHLVDELRHGGSCCWGRCWQLFLMEGDGNHVILEDYGTENRLIFDDINFTLTILKGYKQSSECQNITCQEIGQLLTLHFLI